MAAAAKNHAQICRKAAFGVLLVSLLLGRSVAVHGAEDEPTRPARFSVPLEYREHSDPKPVIYLPVDSAVSFAKEPEVPDARWRRGSFKTGTQPLGFAWDQTHGKLYLDLNRNLDLTDDPESVFPAEGKPSSGNFPGVRFDVDTSAGRCPFLVDLRLYDYGGTQIGGSAVLRSFFRGRLELQGSSWEVGVLKNPFEPLDSSPGTQLLLRPWDPTTATLHTNSEIYEAASYRSNLFLQGEAFRAATAFATVGGKPGVGLQLERLDLPLGEVRITGQFVRRLLLYGEGDWLVILDQLDATVRVPAVRYPHQQVWLRKDGAEAQAYLNDTLNVAPDGSAVLPAGGPLTNVVRLSRRGRALRLDYELQGNGGHRYKLAGPRSEAAPEFVIFQGDRRLASGKFEFG